MKRRLLLMGAGAIAALGLPPVHFLAAWILGFLFLLFVWERAPTPRARFFAGFWFGWGYFIAGNYWMSISLLVEPEKFAWLIPFSLFGLTAALAIFPALACWLAGFGTFRGAARPMWFALCWTSVEYLRGHMLTGFPWNLAAAAAPESVQQWASWVGAYGVSFLLMWFAAALASALEAKEWELTRRLLTVVFVGAVVAFAGSLRLYMAGPVENIAYVPTVKLRLVQPNIPQADRWDAASELIVLQDHIQLSLLSEGLSEVTHIIWPESGVPFFINEQPRLIRLLEAVAPQKGALITGTLRSDSTGSDSPIYNSIAVVTREDGLVAAYDKRKLVPFGEFIPLRHALPFLSTIAPGPRDFSAGGREQILSLPGLPPFAPLICYEAIFPELSHFGAESPRPRWLLNVTNDAWFGISSGPYQHFDMARMRAVEQGLPLVRAANTGISGVIDPYGRVVARRGLGEKAYLDSRLPEPIAGGTIYGRYGDIGLLALMGLSLFVTILFTRKRQN